MSYSYNMQVKLFDALSMPDDDWMEFYWLCQVPGDAWLLFGWIMGRLPRWEKLKQLIEYIDGVWLYDDDANFVDYAIPLRHLNPTAMRDALIKFIEGE